MCIMSYIVVDTRGLGCEEIYAHKYAISRARGKRFSHVVKAFDFSLFLPFS